MHAARARHPGAGHRRPQRRRQRPRARRRECPGKAESGLRAGLGQLFALAENYPQLKANESFQFLSQRISGLENGIADRRELYNEAVNLNNVRIEQFPDLLIARVAGFKAAELLQFSEAEKADVDLKALFG
ncbi:LemA family protein [Pseudomonas aeruginosa]|nr:LemA family protein [Pseudomonas aeruginosa]